VLLLVILLDGPAKASLIYKDCDHTYALSFSSVCSLPDSKKTLITQGATPWPMTPEQFSARIQSDRKRYGRIIEENNLSAE